MKWILALWLTTGCTAANNSLTNHESSDGGDDGGEVDLAMTLATDLASLSLPDLARSQGPDDLAGQDFGGVSCGNMTCGASQICCAQRAGGGGTSAMCVAPGSCPDGGVAAACDGPEDCPNTKPSCCATVSGTMMMTGAGMAECTASCMGSLTLAGGVMVRTKLCHSDADCSGFTGTFNGNSSSWDACCHQNMAPASAPHFCANSGFAAFGGYSCP